MKNFKSYVLNAPPSLMVLETPLQVRLQLYLVFQKYEMPVAATVVGRHVMGVLPSLNSLAGKFGGKKFHYKR